MRVEAERRRERGEVGGERVVEDGSEGAGEERGSEGGGGGEGG